MAEFKAVRQALAGCCFFLGSVWGAAGAFKLIFGTHITLLLLPPLDLARVAPVTLAVAVAFFALGAWVGRSSVAPVEPAGLEAADASREQLLAASVGLTPPSEKRSAMPVGPRSPSAQRMLHCQGSFGLRRASPGVPFRP